MRCLLLAPEPPVPARSGLPLRILHLARALASEHEVTVAAVSDEPPAPQAAQEPFTLIHLPGDWSRRRTIWRAAREPWAMAQIHSPIMAEHARGGGWEVVQCHGAAMMRHAPAGQEVIYDAADVMHTVTASMAATDSRPTMRPLWRLDSARTRRVEAGFARGAAAVTAASELDGDEFARLGAHRVVLVSNGVDVTAITFAPPPAGAEIAFVGYFGWRPNLEAARELIDQILPRVRSQRDDARLALVGAGAPGRLGKHSHAADVRLTGGVADVRPHLRRARVSVIPLRAGGGTSIKVLEAFAAGVPVVATPFAVRGLEVRHGRHALLAETPQDLADLALRVIGSDELARSLAGSARELVERRYDWRTVTRPLVELYRDLAKGHRSRAGAAL